MRIPIETKGYRRPIIGVIIAALVLLLTLTYGRMIGWNVPAQTIQAQPSPPVSEGGAQQGQAQELRVREVLQKEGYEQPLGNIDTAIRQNLGLKANEGKIADFVGRNSANDRWLVAESKGGDLRSAVRQLDNTAQRLWQRNMGANPANTEFRVYTNSNQFSKLQVPVNESKMGGYVMRDGYLGYTDEMGEWIYETINGSRILVFLAP